MERLTLASAIGWGFPTWVERDAMTLLTTLGIQCVQVFRNREKNIPAADIRGPLTDAGFTITSLHAFFGPDYNPSLPDEAARQASVDNLVREADYCRDLGGAMLIVHPGEDPAGADTTAPARRDALRRSAEALAAAGEREHMVFALENLPPGVVGDSMAMLREIVDEVDSPQLGINYDCGHANLSGDPVEILRQGGPRILGTHIHDNLGADDNHLPPGFGSVDIEAVCRELAAIGYRGAFMLELMEPVAMLRDRFSDAYLSRLTRWLDLASGLVS